MAGEAVSTWSGIKTCSLTQRPIDLIAETTKPFGGPSSPPSPPPLASPPPSLTLTPSCPSSLLPPSPPSLSLPPLPHSRVFEPLPFSSISALFSAQHLCVSPLYRPRIERRPCLPLVLPRTS